MLFAALLTGCAGLALHRAVPVRDLLPVVAVAAGAPAVLVAAWATGRRRLSLWVAAPASILVWLLVAGGTVLRADAVAGLLPGTAVLRDIGTGMRGSWPGLLATILPAPPRPALLATLSGVVWLAGYAAAELAARTRPALAPVPPPLLLLTLGLLFGVGGPGSNLPVVVGFVVLAASLALVRRPAGAAPVRLVRRYASGVPVIAVVAVAAGSLGPHLPLLAHRKPFDLRRYVVPTRRPHPALDPLDQLSAWLATPDLPLFSAVPAGSGAAAEPTAWRIAALDSFDGRTWSMGGQFVTTGQRVPLPPARPARTARRVFQVTIAGLTGVWLPAAEAPVSLTGTPVLVDPGTGVLLSDAGLRPGLRYTVASLVPGYYARQLRFAVPASDVEARAALALPPGLPDTIAAEARRATGGATFPAQQAARLETYLRDTEKNDPAAPPGHSYGHLAYFLAAHRGSTEQFATAYAVMARTLGLPTRVVVGFGPGRPGPGGWTVRGADALAWPEVDFRGIGWVPFYPTPETSNSPAGTRTVPAGATGQRQEIDENLVTAPATQVRRPDSARVTARAAASRLTSPRPWWWALVAAITIILFGLCYLVVVLFVPYLRSRRRRAARAAGGGDSVVAAWAEAVYRLGPLRLGDLSTLTTGQVAEAAARRLDAACAPWLDELASLADAAAFAAGPLPDQAGAVAWRHVYRIAERVPVAAGRAATVRYRLRPAAVRG